MRSPPVVELPPVLQGDSIIRLLLGAFVGFAATAIIGFTWGGWTMGKTAKQMAEQRAAVAAWPRLLPSVSISFGTVPKPPQI